MGIPGLQQKSIPARTRAMKSQWNDSAARQRFLQLLEAQGLEDPWSAAQRRRLSAVLFT